MSGLPAFGDYAEDCILCDGSGYIGCLNHERRSLAKVKCPVCLGLGQLVVLDK